MSYGSHALQCEVPVDLRPAWLKPASRVIGEGTRWLGRGCLFAATVYLMVALPGLID